MLVTSFVYILKNQSIKHNFVWIKPPAVENQTIVTCYPYGLASLRKLRVTGC